MSAWSLFARLYAYLPKALASRAWEKAAVAAGLVLALGLLLSGGPASALAKPNQGAASAATSSATPAASSAASPTVEEPAPPPGRPATPPERGGHCPECKEHALIVVGILLTTALGTIVAVFPIGAYIATSWGWRQHMIFCSLSANAKDQYLHLYHRNAIDPASADKRFAGFYQRWFGRSRLIGPAAVICAIILFYAFLMACYASQLLFKFSIVYLIPHDPQKELLSSLGVAMAAIAGAYTLVSLDAIGRVIRRDLSPEDLYLYALRYMSCVPVGFALSSLVKNDAAMIIAFSVGAFPLQAIADILRRNAQKQLGETARLDSATDLITKLSGVDAAVFTRMSDIGVTTIAQLAESDPIQLTMRTNLAFPYLLDLTSQALAWNYLEAKLALIRPMGLRGACELGVLNTEANTDGSPYQANAAALIAQAGATLGLTPEQFNNVLHQVADDPYTAFLIEAYG